MASYKAMLVKELEKRKGLSIKNISGKSFLYSHGKYLSPASHYHIQLLQIKSSFLKWTLKNLDQILLSAKLLSNLSKHTMK
jgi:hypothetical protein